MKIIRIAWIAWAFIVCPVFGGDSTRVGSAMEFLQGFEAPYYIDRSPNRKLIPKGEALLLDGGTRVTILRDRKDQQIAVTYYGKNSQFERGEVGLLAFCMFTDSDGYGEPSYSLRRGSPEEAALARILLAVPLREVCPELREIGAEKLSKTQQGVTPSD